MEPFEINVPEEVLEDMKNRLAMTRWPDEVDDAGWDYGTNLSYMKNLCEYWQNDFDWKAQEARLNELSHFRTEIDGLEIHFVHEKGKGPDPTPLLLTHGWPDSFFRFYKLIPMLTDPESYGGNTEDSFDVIVPSVPGYGFSERPSRRGVDDEVTAHIFAKLMTEVLGYERYFAHGADVGSGVTEKLARNYPDSVGAIHLADIPYVHLFAYDAGDLTEAEQQYLQRGYAWSNTEGAYAMLQSTRPQTPAYGLNDSPVGLAAWIVEKFRSWSDGELEDAFTKDELLINITIYWVTQTIGSSFRMYYEPGGWDDDVGSDDGKCETPTGVAIFPKDIVPAPREFGERVFNVRRWTEMPAGGHFAALEEPELLAEDLRTFFREYR